MDSGQECSRGASLGVWAEAGLGFLNCGNAWFFTPGTAATSEMALGFPHLGQAVGYGAPAARPWAGQLCVSRWNFNTSLPLLCKMVPQKG